MVATMTGGRVAKALGSKKARRRELVDGGGGGGGKANLKVNMNGGLEADLRPTADPFDRAHNVHLGAYLACAADPRTGAPSRNLVARPRRYHPSNLVAELRVSGAPVGRVGVDSAADDLADRLDWIAMRFGVDLLRGGRCRTVMGMREEVFQQVRIRDLLEPAGCYDRRRKASRKTPEGIQERMVQAFLVSVGAEGDAPRGHAGGRRRKSVEPQQKN